MNAAPKEIDSFRVVCYSPIDEPPRFTGNTRQIVNGLLMGAMFGLAICQAGDKEFYLYGCDSDWKTIADTWHESVEDAKRQAEFEYEGIDKTWIDVA